MSDQQPSALRNLALAAAGALPFVPRSDTLPRRSLTVDELTIDAADVAEYCHVTGLRFDDTVPITYPFALTFRKGSLPDFEAIAAEIQAAR